MSDSKKTVKNVSTKRMDCRVLVTCSCRAGRGEADGGQNIRRSFDF